MIYYYEKNEQDRQQEGRRAETLLAHRVLAAALKTERGIELLPQIDRDDRGKPYFREKPELFFNYSHCRTGILCGIADSSIGVDAEARRTMSPNLARHICHENELRYLGRAEDAVEALLGIWTAKEAYLKYTGAGIRESLRDVDTTPVLGGEGEIVPGVFLRRWQCGGMFLAACSQDERSLRLHPITKI